MGLSGILPSVVASIQDAGANPRFSATVYFGIHASLLFLSYISFILILRLDVVRQHRRNPNVFSQIVSSLSQTEFHEEASFTKREKGATITNEREKAEKGNGENAGNPHSQPKQTDIPESAVEGNPLLHSAPPAAPVPPILQTFQHRVATSGEWDVPSTLSAHPVEEQDPLLSEHPPAQEREPHEEPGAAKSKLKLSEEAPNFGLMLIISSANYFVPGFAPLFVGGFENPSTVLLWFNVLGMVGGTIGRFLCIFASHSKPRRLTVITLCFFALLFVFGAPISFNFVALVATHFFFQFLFGFTNTMFYKVGSISFPVPDSEVVCKWLGVSEQLGALLGSLASFLLVLLEVLPM